MVCDYIVCPEPRNVLSLTHYSITLLKYLHWLCALDVTLHHLVLTVLFLLITTGAVTVVLTDTI